MDYVQTKHMYCTLHKPHYRCAIYTLYYITHTHMHMYIYTLYNTLYVLTYAEEHQSHELELRRGHRLSGVQIHHLGYYRGGCTIG